MNPRSDSISLFIRSIKWPIVTIITYMSTKLDDKGLLYELEARLEAKKAELRDLATMGAVITSIHEIESVLSVVMDMAIRLVNGEVGVILLDEEGELKAKTSWGVSDEFVKSLKYQDEDSLVAYCHDRKTTVLQGAGDFEGEQDPAMTSLICAPIKTSQTCYGVMVIINKADGGSFSDEDKEILEMLLSFVAVAIDNSLLIEDKLARQRIEQEIAVARQIQETILPADIEHLPGADIGAVYYPAREVGGDFYDVIKIDESRFIVIIGEVSNKGIPAALVMSAAAGIIRATVASDPAIDVAHLASKLNNTLAEHIIKDRGMFVTLFFSRFDLESGTLTYCNAGHLPGLFYSVQSKTVTELATGGTIVGQFLGVPFKQGAQKVTTGDRLFLFTDGLTEAANAGNVLYGRERVEEVFKDHIDLTPQEFCVKVKGVVDLFTMGASEDFLDDFTLLQVKVK